MIVKKYEDLTEEDKNKILNAGAIEFEMMNGKGSWSRVEKQMQEFLNKAFDDAKFPMMSANDQIDAAYARKEFGKRKPSIAEYSAWVTKYSTHMEMFEVPE